MKNGQRYRLHIQFQDDIFAYIEVATSGIIHGWGELDTFGKNKRCYIYGKMKRKKLTLFIIFESLRSTIMLNLTQDKEEDLKYQGILSLEIADSSITKYIESCSVTVMVNTKPDIKSFLKKVEQLLSIQEVLKKFILVSNYIKQMEKSGVFV